MNIMRQYPDGTSIPVNLPRSYQTAEADNVPQDQACSNCSVYYSGYCKRWSAPVRSYWCLSWQPSNE